MEKKSKKCNQFELEEYATAHKRWKEKVKQTTNRTDVSWKIMQRCRSEILVASTSTPNSYSCQSWENQRKDDIYDLTYKSWKRCLGNWDWTWLFVGSLQNKKTNFHISFCQEFLFIYEIWNWLSSRHNDWPHFWCSSNIN